MSRVLTVALLAALGLWGLLAASPATANGPGVVWDACFAFDPVFIQGDVRQPEMVLPERGVAGDSLSRAQSNETPAFDLDLTIDGERRSTSSHRPQARGNARVEVSDNLSRLPV